MEKPIIKMVSFSQNGEDVVLDRAFRDRSPGFYVDLGSGHPVRGSVTKHLHDRLGWRGLDVEPMPHLCELLRQARSRSHVVNAAVGAKNEQRMFTEFPDNWAMSTLDPGTADRHRKSGLPAKSYIVDCITLNSLLANQRVKHGFELLKIDVEGGEFEVLEGFDFALWRPKVILIETTIPGTNCRCEPKLLTLFRENGYKESLFDGINSFFVRDSESELFSLLSVCANPHDGFVPLRWWRLFSETFRKQYPNLPQVDLG